MNPRLRQILSLVFALGFLSLTAQNGFVDTSFGEQGWIFHSPDATKWGQFTDVVAQPDGRILAGGWYDDKTFLTRYMPSGLVDTSFGEQGVVEPSLIHNGSYSDWSSINNLILQPDGKILLNAGPAYSSNQYLKIRRLLNSGTLDSSFGMNGSVELVNFGEAISTEITGGNKILVVTSRQSLGFVIIQLTSSGEIDSSFGLAGVVMFKSFVPLPISFRPSTIAWTSANKILVGGWAQNTQESVYCLLHSDGQLDTTFAVGGVLRNFGYSSPQKIIITPNDEFIVCGGGQVIYYPLDGKIDALVGNSGVYNTSIPGRSSYFESISMLEDGGILALGSSVKSGYFHFTAQRFFADHTRDWTFGGMGEYIYTDSNSSFLSAVAINGTTFYAAGYHQNSTFCEINNPTLAKFSYVNSIGLQEEKAYPTSTFTIYPNPAKSLVTINSKKEQDFSLFTLSGKLLLSTESTSTEFTIDVRALPYGVYLLKGSLGNFQRILVSR